MIRSRVDVHPGDIGENRNFARKLSVFFRVKCYNIQKNVYNTQKLPPEFSFLEKKNFFLSFSDFSTLFFDPFFRPIFRWGIASQKLFFAL